MKRTKPEVSTTQALLVAITIMAMVISISVNYIPKPIKATPAYGFDIPPGITPTFKDKDGNPLPHYAVELLIKSQHSGLTESEADTLNHYFPYWAD